MNIHNGRIGIGSGAFFYACAVWQALGIADGVFFTADFMILARAGGFARLGRVVCLYKRVFGAGGVNAAFTLF